MSRQSQYQSNAANPVCGHCANMNNRAGYTKHDTNHWSHATADPTSAVVCVELQKLVCRWCNGNGHTISYCSEKKNHDQRNRCEQRDLRTRPAPAAMATPTKKASTNPFASLGSDSEDEQKAATKKATKAAKAAKALTATKKIIEFPQIGDPCPTLSLIHPDKLSFAEALAKPVEPMSANVFVKMLALSGYKKDTRSWADQSDSEDEGSDDELDGDGFTPLKI